MLIKVKAQLQNALEKVIFFATTPRIPQRIAAEAIAIKAVTNAKESHSL